MPETPRHPGRVFRGDVALLDAEDERTVLASARAGRREALEKLLLAHMPLVQGIVSRYHRRGLSREDLVAEGVLGLVEAAQRFEPERGVRFSTYAAWWVRAQVRRFAASTLRIVRPPSTRVARRLVVQLGAAQRRLGRSLGRAPSCQELAAELGATAEEVASVEAALGRGDTSFDEGAHSLPLSGAQEGPEAEVAAAQGRALILAKVHTAMGTLSERERQIVQRRLLDEERPTLSVLGRDLGISRERVRQLEEKARAKLRHALSDVA